MMEDLATQLQLGIFAFGDYSSHVYGWLRFDGDSLVSGSYPHAREAFYRLSGPVLELICADGDSVTARFELVQRHPLLFHGSTVGLNNSLYLREALSLRARTQTSATLTARPAVLVNSAPKSGTYLLQRAFFELGFSSTDLHLGNTSLHDNRDLPRDASIHRAPWAHEATLATGLLPPFLGPGTVTVGHIDDVSVLQTFIDAGLCVLLVVRDMRAILWSLFRFKLAVVVPRDDADHHWRCRASRLEQFMGFLAYHWSHDIPHICNCFRSFASFPDVPLLRYEDLMAGAVPEATAHLIEQQLADSGGTPAFLAALAAARHRSTPTLTPALPHLPSFTPEEQEEIRRLIDAFVVGSSLAEVNALFGYG
jgi:hypothetical protein